MIIVSYPLSEVVSLGDKDAEIDAYMAQHGIERDGSGAGFGMRDLEYVAPGLEDQFMLSNAADLRQRLGVEVGHYVDAGDE